MIRTVLTALALAATAASIAAAPALAQDVISIKVSYSDLNLNSTAGAAVLQRRIDAAVEQICGRAQGSDLNQRALVAQCRREVSSGPVAQGRQAVANARQSVIALTQQSQVIAAR